MLAVFLLHSLFLGDCHERRKLQKRQGRELCGGVSQRTASARLAERDARVETALQSGRHIEELDISQEDEDELPRTASHTTSEILILIQTPNPLRASRAELTSWVVPLKPHLSNLTK